MRLHTNGILELKNGWFSRIYHFPDTNYLMASQEDREEIFCNYEHFLNRLNSEVNAQITIDRHPDPDTGNLINEKYITFLISASSPEEANCKFAKMEIEYTSAIRRIHSKNINPLTNTEIKDMWKDIPDSSDCNFYSSYFKTGDQYACCLWMKEFQNTPMSLNNISSFPILNNFLDSQYKRRISIHYNQMKADEAFQYCEQNLKRNGKEKTSFLLDEITKENKNLFSTALVVTLFGDTKEELKINKYEMEMIGRLYHVSLRTLYNQQKKGFQASFPIGKNSLNKNLILRSESAASFLPFSMPELKDKDGLPYGIHIVSHNPILLNRKTKGNTNGVILGAYGSGTLQAAAQEIRNVLTNTQDSVIIIDSDGNFAPLAEEFHGDRINLSSETSFLNPMDLAFYSDIPDEWEQSDKTDFMIHFCEVMVGKNLTNDQKDLISKCIKEIYQPYLEHMKELHQTNPGTLFDFTQTPTFKDFYELLKESKLNDFLSSMEPFRDLFSHQTTEPFSNRLTILDISGYPDGKIKKLQEQACLSALWNQIRKNCRSQTYTWFYLMDSVSPYLKFLYRRARGQLAIPTLILRDLSDYLNDPALLCNSSFIFMLRQNSKEMESLSSLFSLSQMEIDFVNGKLPSANPRFGRGLLLNGRSMIPIFLPELRPSARP